MTKSTCVSSAESPSNYSISDEGSFDLVDLDAGFDQNTVKVDASNNQSAPKVNTPVIAQAQASANPANAKIETTWKKKVKTELCRFWLNG